MIQGGIDNLPYFLFMLYTLYLSLKNKMYQNKYLATYLMFISYQRDLTEKIILI